MEYGSARWGTQKDIEPFEDPVFANNVILTRTERLMMGNRPKNPANARNKNVLVVGGSGSGKTRFWLKPNLLQCHSSYVVTDPKGDIVIDCGQALLKNGYSKMCIRDRHDAFPPLGMDWKCVLYGPAASRRCRSPACLLYTSFWCCWQAWHFERSGHAAELKISGAVHRHSR